MVREEEAAPKRHENTRWEVAEWGQWRFNLMPENEWKDEDEKDTRSSTELGVAPTRGWWPLYISHKNLIRCWTCALPCRHEYNIYIHTTIYLFIFIYYYYIYIFFHYFIFLYIFIPNKEIHRSKIQCHYSFYPPSTKKNPFASYTSSLILNISFLICQYSMYIFVCVCVCACLCT